jgi:2-amino-4-hydroxy-6-hydroxymethyldihydropteridine diphosphokinase
MPTCLLGLGSNLGDSARLLSEAVARLQNRPHIEVLRQSRFRETSPVGGPAGQAAYLNAAAVVRTSLSPRELLKECQEIENSRGRRREERWGPRTIDIDLLLYDDLVLDEPDLQIPHPRMAWRRFVIESAAEIAAEMVHPVIRWTVGHLLYHLNSTPWYLAIEGPAESGKRFLASALARRFRARLLDDPFDSDLVTRAAYCQHNPSGRERRIKLEFLEKRARQLDCEDPVWAMPDRPTVSDFWSEFWFEQSLSRARHYLAPEEYAHYMTIWNKLRLRIVRPRLLAIVRLQPDAFRGIRVRNRLGNDFPEETEPIRQDLEKQTSAAAGPVLRLDTSNSQAALVELTAAVEAMR